MALILRVLDRTTDSSNSRFDKRPLGRYIIGPTSAADANEQQEQGMQDDDFQERHFEV